MLKCNLCYLKFTNSWRLLHHCKTVHKNDPNLLFKCGCGETFRRWGGLKSHFKRKHRIADQIHNSSLEEVTASNEPQTEHVEEIEINPEIDIVRRFAQFILCMKHKHNLTQTAIDAMIENMNYFIEQHLNSIKKNLVSQNLYSPDLDQLLSSDPVFTDQLTGKYKQEKYFAANFNLLSPQPVLLGTTFVWKLNKCYRLTPKNREHLGYVMPFRETLARLLSDPSVSKEITNLRTETGTYKDIQDGSFYQAHPILIDGRNLGIVCYFDDLEVVNPLGTKTKTHKISVFYWFLTNIRPEFRSSLRTIQLLGIAKTSDLKKFGMVKFLDDFVSAMKELSSEDGLLLNVCGEEKHVHGALVAFPADTLASNLMGGFKESPSFAKRPCRICFATKENLNQGVCEANFQLRNKELHNDHVLTITDSTLTPKARKYWSKYYGINGVSVLQDIPHFDITKCLVLDIMHVLLKGVLQHHMKAFIRHCCFLHGYCTLDDLNTKIKTFCYVETPRKDIPSPLQEEDIKKTSKKMKQKAAQTMELSLMLPFILPDIPEESYEYLECFLLLQKITFICLAFEITPEQIVQFAKLIEAYLAMFKRLYPNESYTPKMHYLLHLPSQIEMFGPLRHLWCMRFEAVHAQLKLAAQVQRNFKNIPLSLSKKHEGRMSFNFLGSDFLYEGDEVISASVIYLTDQQMNLLNQVNVIDAGRRLAMTANQVRVNHIVYKPGVYLLAMPATAEELPQFWRCKEIIIYEDGKYLILYKIETLFFCERFNAYSVEPTCQHYQELECKSVRNLKYFCPLRAYRDKHGSIFVSTLLPYANTELV